jgi:hypothetical protein
MAGNGESDNDLRRVIIAILGAVGAFFLVGLGIYWKLANVRVNGFVALVVLILLLQRR